MFLRPLLLIVLSVVPLAAVEVTSPANDGPGSFRAAASANQITITPALAGVTVTLESPVVIDHEVLIDATAAPGFTLSGGGKVRILETKGPTTVIRGVTFVDGLAGGKDRDSGAGGGLYAHGHAQLVLQKCVFRGNQARGEGGGGLYVGYRQTSLIEDCVFERNDATECVGERAGGGIATASEGNLTVRRSVFTANRGGIGGGINSLLGALLVEGCTFTDNTTRAEGKGTDGYGAAIYTDGASAKTDDAIGGTIVVRDCRFIGNTGHGQGGACFLFAYAPDTVALERCVFQGNRVEKDGKGDALGGGLRVGAATTITDCAFIGNSAPSQGGALWMGEKSNLAVRNTLFSGNRSDGLAAVMALMTSGSVTLDHCTFVDNSTKTGCLYFGSGVPSFTACLMADNSGSAANGPATDGGGNLVWKTEVTLPGAVAANPQLRPLQEAPGSLPARLPADASLIGKVGAGPVASATVAKTPGAEKDKSKPKDKPKAEPKPAVASPGKELATLVEGGFDAPTRDDALAAVKAYLKAQAGTGAVVRVRLMTPDYVEATLDALDDRAVTVLREGNAMPLPWRLFTDNDVVEMALPLIAKAPADVHAAWIFLGVYAGRVDKPSNRFRAFVDPLWAKDEATARRVDDVLQKLQR